MRLAIEGRLEEGQILGGTEAVGAIDVANGVARATA